MPDARHQIGFEQLGIGSVIRRNWLRVPLHQREYSWTDREVTHLLHDLNRAITSGAHEYFLGSIVTIPRDEGVLEVVDGQQRLATTAILLGAIRDFLAPREQDKTIVDDVENILRAIDRSARGYRSRLRLNVKDHEFFEQRVLANNATREGGLPPSHALIDQAADLARAHVRRVVSSHDEAHHGDVLNQWIDYIEHRSIVVLLKVPSAINAYRMFETLNDRGLRTSQSDLVKNYLFGEAGDRIGEAQQGWASMRAILESFEDDDITVNYLRQLLVSLHGSVRSGDVYDTVAKKVKGATQAIGFLSLLESGAADYAAILNPKHEKWNAYPTAIRRSLEATLIVRLKTIRPLMLAVARTFSPREAARAVNLILNASVRLMIAGGAKSAGRSGSVEAVLTDAAKDVSAGEITTAEQLLSSLNAIVPKDEKFSDEFAKARVTRIALARYYLRSLEQAAKEEPEPWHIPNDDPAVINLEHILPRKPGDAWPEFSPDAAEAAYRRLGNMCLLQATTNSNLKSAPFSEKVETYADSPYSLTSQVADADRWSTGHIQARQAQLAALAAKTWPLSVPR